MSRWRREAKHGWPDWLYILEGKTSRSYWIRYRKDGIRIEERLEGAITKWTDARAEGNKVLDRALLGRAQGKTPAGLIRTETLCHEVVKLREGRAKSTYVGIEKMMRLHIIPYVNAFAPLASQLSDATEFDRYKLYKRLKDPSISLADHYKFWTILVKHPFEEAALDQPFLDLLKRGSVKAPPLGPRTRPLPSDFEERFLCDILKNPPWVDDLREHFADQPIAQLFSDPVIRAFVSALILPVRNSSVEEEASKLLATRPTLRTKIDQAIEARSATKDGPEKLMQSLLLLKEQSMARRASELMDEIALAEKAGDAKKAEELLADLIAIRDKRKAVARGAN